MSRNKNAETILLGISHFNHHQKSIEAKFVQMTFITRRETCPPNLERLENPSSREDAKYLGLHLNRGLN